MNITRLSASRMAVSTLPNFDAMSTRPRISVPSSSATDRPNSTSRVSGAVIE